MIIDELELELDYDDDIPIDGGNYDDIEYFKDVEDIDPIDRCDNYECPFCIKGDICIYGEQLPQRPCSLYRYSEDDED